MGKYLKEEGPISWSLPNPTCGTANPHRLSGVSARQVDERWRPPKSRSGCQGQEAKHRIMNCEWRPRCAPRLGQGQPPNKSLMLVLRIAFILSGLRVRLPVTCTASPGGSRESHWILVPVLFACAMAIMENMKLHGAGTSWLLKTKVCLSVTN